MQPREHGDSVRWRGGGDGGGTEQGMGEQRSYPGGR